MSRSFKIMFLAIFETVIGSGQILAQSRPTDSVNRDVPVPRVIVSLKIYRNFLVVAEGQIGGVTGEQNLVLDTGVNPTIINVRLARQLGLADAQSTMAAVGRGIPTKIAILRDLSLGPMQVASLRVQVQDLSRLERDFGIPIAAIVGMDVLSKESFRLDYAAQQIEFGNVSGQGVPVAFDLRIGVALADVQLNGRSARMVLDTGSEEVVLFGGNFPGHFLATLHPAFLRGSSLSAQPLPVRELSILDIRIANQYFQANKAYLLPDSSDPVFDGLLGVRAVRCRAIEYDKDHRLMYLQ